MKVTVDYVLETADLRKIEYTAPSEHKTAILAGNENDRLKHHFGKHIPRVAEVTNRFNKEGYDIAPAHPEMTDLLLYIWESKMKDMEVIDAAKNLLSANIKGSKHLDAVSESFTKIADRYGFTSKPHSFVDKYKTEKKVSLSTESSRAG